MPQNINPNILKNLSRDVICHTTFLVPSAFGAEGVKAFVHPDFRKAMASASAREALTRARAAAINWPLASNRAT